MVTPAAIRVLLPNASASEQIATKKNVSLILTADRKYFLNDTPIERSEIKAALASLANMAKEKNEDINVLLQADKTLNLQEVVDVIDIGNELSIKMVLFTQKPK